MESFFKSIFSDDISYYAFFIVLIVSLFTGIIFSFIIKYKSNSSKSFYISTAIMPCCVAMVIMLVNGNIGAGVAVAGAFSLVRFRSASGSAKEISIIFIDMVIGLALGMGYIAYGVIFSIIAVIAIFVLSNNRILDNKVDSNERHLKIIVPENVDYVNLFDDIFNKYLNEYKLNRAKLCNMGSMFSLYYDIKINNDFNEKNFIDELRCRNGNLEIVLERVIYEEKEL